MGDEPFMSSQDFCARLVWWAALRGVPPFMLCTHALELFTLGIDHLFLSRCARAAWVVGDARRRRRSERSRRTRGRPRDPEVLHLDVQLSARELAREARRQPSRNRAPRRRKQAAEAEHVGDHAGRDQQQAADKHEDAADQTFFGHTPGGLRGAKLTEYFAALGADEGRAEQAHRNGVGQRVETADGTPDTNQQPEVRKREQYEREEEWAHLRLVTTYGLRAT
jgi:hypothetical protein